MEKNEIKEQKKEAYLVKSILETLYEGYTHPDEKIIEVKRIKNIEELRAGEGIFTLDYDDKIKLVYIGIINEGRYVNPESDGSEKEIVMGERYESRLEEDMAWSFFRITFSNNYIIKQSDLETKMALRVMFEGKGEEKKEIKREIEALIRKYRDIDDEFELDIDELL